MSDVTSIRSKGGCSFPVTKIGDRNYFAYPLVPDFCQRLADIWALEVRPEDVFVGGMPKSGNHWCYELVSMIMNQTTNIAKEMPFVHHPECFATSDLAETAQSWPSPRIIFYHGRLTSEMPAQIVEAKPKIVYVLRNPKDILVSAFSFYKLLNGSFQFNGTWEDFLEMNLAGEFPPDTWFDHVLDADKFIEENPGISFHLLVYEKMKEDLEGEVRKLCQFLGKPTDMAKEIAAAGEFQTFKPAMETSKLDEADRSKLFFTDHAGGKIFRKGKVGDWKNMFTVSQSEAVDLLFEKKMAESKLAYHVQAYI